jgi:UDP-N-acetylglucosamine 1-carboxyvinyltransferase
MRMHRQRTPFVVDLPVDRVVVLEQQERANDGRRSESAPCKCCAGCPEHVFARYADRRTDRCERMYASAVGSRIWLCEAVFCAAIVQRELHEGALVRGRAGHSPGRCCGRERELECEMAVTLAGPLAGGAARVERRRKTMEKFVIEGGVPLSGTLVPAGNKNGALAILAASVLTEDEVLVRNVPRIRDVEAMIEILVSIGVSASWQGANELALCAAGVEEAHIDARLAESIRASFLLAGPLLARLGRAVMPPPGGDVIGRRRLDPHLDAFRAMGALTDCGREIALTAPRGLRPTDVFMDEPSVMATENALMAAALTPGTTVIGNAASEPHVQDLARMLVKMGADIQGIGSNLITVHGATRLRGCEHDVAPDHIEIGSFMALAGVTGGELRIKDTVPSDLRMIRLVFERVGLRSELQGNDVVVPGNQRLVVQADVGEYKSKIQDGPWPAFPADLTSIAVALATQAEGSILVHEWMFENRLIFTDKLILMGADIVMCDPHRAIVTGPRRLRGERVESPDIRAGMAMLLAALCADGRSEIGNIRQIDRGYERIDERLRDLGARIERVATEPVHA